MKKFRFPKFNLKYIIGEIVLLFVGINLAIWFNDWNTSKTVRKDKEVALIKIKEEIRNNLNELKSTRAHNQKIPLFFKGLNDLKNQGEEARVSSEKMKAFVKKYSEFFEKVDSIPIGNGLYEYEGETFVNIEITDLSSIAWDVSKSTGIFHEFGYDCLYELESMYNLQGLVQKEFENAVEALQKDSTKKLLRVLGFVNQLDGQLERKYLTVLENLKNCK